MRIIILIVAVTLTGCSNTPVSKWCHPTSTTIETSKLMASCRLQAQNIAIPYRQQPALQQCNTTGRVDSLCVMNNTQLQLQHQQRVKDWNNAKVDIFNVCMYEKGFTIVSDNQCHQ